MSLVTKAIGCAKKLKHRFRDGVLARTPVYLSPVRRIERVALKERIVAMTFDDGPCALPANPPADGDKPLTLCILETLEKYGALGTFDVVGDTSKNYPDTVGREGTAAWGGVKFDHYPDFKKDSFGGVKSCPELTKRILDGGHEITSHSWAHVLFGPKPLVYGKRDPLENIDKVIADLKMMDDHMRENYGYTVRLSRPPHYVDKTYDGLSSYDAYAVMGYQYLAAAFDGAGWLPLSSYEAEVEAMTKPLADALAADPDSLCGQIIFQKDGYNMSRRSPVAHGLEEQLKLLCRYGYRVVTVSQLMNMCPFSDVFPDSAVFAHAKALLERGLCVCYRDNTLRPGNILTRGELAMMLYGGGKRNAERRIELVHKKQKPAGDMSFKHPYAAAAAAALKSGEMTLQNGKFLPDEPVTSVAFADICKKHFGREIMPPVGALTHEKAITALAQTL